MLTLADGRLRVDITLTEPPGYSVGDDVLELTLADLTDLIDTAQQINKPDFRLSATGSETVPDQPLEKEGNATTFGASAYEGNVTVLRQVLATGQIDPSKDTVFTAIGEKGALAYYLQRIGPKATVPLAVGDEGWIYEAISDSPQEPTDRNGYVKNPITLGVQSRRRFKIIAGG